MILLVAVGIYELWREKRRKRTGKRLSATYVDEYTAIFYGTKRMELNHRDSVEMLREEDAQGAPPLRSGAILEPATSGLILFWPMSGQSVAPRCERRARRP